jgi:hypothetical protein
VIRDRKPLKQWSKGRATLVGDAAHPTSPYAGYGAGMATEDGCFIGRRLAGVGLSDYAAVRHALDAFEAPPPASRTPPDSPSTPTPSGRSSITRRALCNRSGTRSWTAPH